jgi:hypothetical protein
MDFQGIGVDDVGGVFSGRKKIASGEKRPEK